MDFRSPLPVLFLRASCVYGATERRQFSPYNIAYFPYFIRKMAESGKRLTTEEVLKFFNDDESLNESNS